MKILYVKLSLMLFFCTDILGAIYKASVFRKIDSLTHQQKDIVMLYQNGSTNEDQALNIMHQVDNDRTESAYLFCDESPSSENVLDPMNLALYMQNNNKDVEFCPLKEKIAVLAKFFEGKSITCFEAMKELLSFLNEIDFPLLSDLDTACPQEKVILAKTQDAFLRLKKNALSIAEQDFAKEMCFEEYLFKKLQPYSLLCSAQNKSVIIEQLSSYIPCLMMWCASYFSFLGYIQELTIYNQLLKTPNKKVVYVFFKNISSSGLLLSELLKIQGYICFKEYSSEHTDLFLHKVNESIQALEAIGVYMFKGEDTTELEKKQDYKNLLWNSLSPLSSRCIASLWNDSFNVAEKASGEGEQVNEIVVAEKELLYDEDVQLAEAIALSLQNLNNESSGNSASKKGKEREKI